MWPPPTLDLTTNMEGANDYLIFCTIEEGEHPFSVKISPNATVDELKKKIKEQKPHYFANIDADELTLYKVDVADDDQRKENVQKKMSELPTPKLLRATWKLNTVYESPPTNGIVHIFAQEPSRKYLVDLPHY
ncbi:hypothetical protein M408DRAFT_228594 [Serendipita vermifera MAFF 305830]|uniref:Crinkler effector protein N-terminal domain-containing protein n=1 Tax=Serendipita vermifera MAFF 305830 TaxID=933852 RepID=A0A0C2X6K4_SERVB|nr:hypothetical protein M408DRAFT_228594 [Serendipita vermifera MAFF 305830]